MWPAWSAPIVGTKAMVPPSARSAASAAPSASMSRTICTRSPPPIEPRPSPCGAAAVGIKSGKVHGRGAFHCLRQRKRRDRQVDDRGPCRRRAGRRGPPRRRDRPRHPPAHARPLSRQPRRDGEAARRRAADAGLRRRSIRPRARRSTPRSTGSPTRCRRSSSSTRPAATIRIARKAMLRADTLVTPINDSFVDLDLIGQVDPETYQASAARASMPSWSGTAAPQRAKAARRHASTGSCSGTACSISRRATCAASARR